MRPRRLQRDTILSMVTTSVATARQSSGRGSTRLGRVRTDVSVRKPGISGLVGAEAVERGRGRGTVEAMVGTALRPLGHLAAWIVWHATRVSLLDDLERPSPPRAP